MENENWKRKRIWVVCECAICSTLNLSSWQSSSTGALSLGSAEGNAVVFEYLLITYSMHVLLHFLLCYKLSIFSRFYKCYSREFHTQKNSLRWSMMIIHFIRHFFAFHLNLYSLISLFTFACVRCVLVVHVLILMK